MATVFTPLAADVTGSEKPVFETQSKEFFRYSYVFLNEVTVLSLGCVEKNLMVVSVFPR
jgi:hypothetical protein